MVAPRHERQEEGESRHGRGRRAGIEAQKCPYLNTIRPQLLLLGLGEGVLDQCKIHSTQHACVGL